MATHALFETASGYAIFQVNFKEDIGSSSKQVQASINDLAKFGRMVSLLSFSPFKNAAHALENSNDISEGALIFVLGFYLGKPSFIGLCCEF
jgi:nucleolar protein 56